LRGGNDCFKFQPQLGKGQTMSLGTILVILLIILLLGGFSGIGGIPYGYGFGHGGIGIVGIILIVVVVLLLMGRL
jgi:Protein of unknown function (DUF3309)